MAKPRVFLSSTFYDLKQVRADIDMFIENLGYEPVRNEEGDIPYGKDDALEEYCYKEIKNIDINSVGKITNDRDECDVLSRSIGVSLCNINSKSTEEIFELGMRVCNITHGNSLIILSSGFLSSFVSLLLKGKDLDTAFTLSLDILRKHPNSDVLVKRLEEKNGDDCLSLCMYYCFKYVNDFNGGVIESKKDNNTVSMLVGSILGLYNGIKEVDSIEILDTISKDINIFLTNEDFVNSDGWQERYVNLMFN